MEGRSVCGVTLVAVLISVVVGCSDATEDNSPVRSIPELRIGMSVSEAKRDLGRRFSLSLDRPGCGYFEIEGAAVGGTVRNGRVEAVGFSYAQPPHGDASGPATGRGLKQGDSLARAIELYGRPTFVSSTDVSISDEIYWQLADERGKHVYLRTVFSADPTERDRGIFYMQIGSPPSIYTLEKCK